MLRLLQVDGLGTESAQMRLVVQTLISHFQSSFVFVCQQKNCISSFHVENDSAYTVDDPKI